MTQEEFETCIGRIRSGDKQGLKNIYDEYLGVIYTAIYGIVKNKEDAEDVTQDFFIKLYSMAPTMEFKEAHKTFLVKVAKNLAIDYFRRSLKTEAVGTYTEPENEIADENDVEEETLGELSVQEVLSTLNEKEQQVIRMKVLSDLTFQEICEITSEPIGTITWRYREAIKKLRRCKYKYEQEF